ncbi:MAG: Uma2 family endonuclease [Methylococcales bacterium]
MQWQEVIDDPVLSELPYKIELNKWGLIEMSPASNRHGIVQSRILRFLAKHLTIGEAFVECSIATPAGVKVGDVVWCSPQFLEQQGERTPYPAAPEICIEVLSPSNRAQVIAEKVELYLNQGATEVWLVDEQGSIEIYGHDGKRGNSSFVEQLPTIFASRAGP